MIPNIDPPPLWTPQGWSPNAMQQSIESLTADMPAMIETLRLANTPAPWYIANRTLTQAEIVTLASSPITVIPSPGADKSVTIWGALLAFEITTVFTNNPSYQFRYTGFVQNNMLISGLAMNALGRKLGFANGNNNAYSVISPSVTPIGTGIQFVATLDLTGAGVLIDASLTVIYSLFDTPASYA